ncbi:hypothetical protein C8R44DRAFT_549557, partial [Mycena epipterygia]
KKATQEASSVSTSIPPAFHKPLPWSHSTRKQQYNTELKGIVVAEWHKSPCYHQVKYYDPSLPSVKFMVLTERM